jgi:GNAT superfamily N-acetyltransferase
VRDAAGVRRAASDEAMAVATLWLRSRRAAAPAIPPPVHGDDEVKAWFRDVVLPKRDLWVVGPRGDPAAMMVLSRGWVEQLYVAPDRFRQGYGSKLLRFAQTRQDELSLWTFEANTQARAFYERHGFVAVGVSAVNEEGVPAVRYRWKVDRSVSV